MAPSCTPSCQLEGGDATHHVQSVSGAQASHEETLLHDWPLANSGRAIKTSMRWKEAIASKSGE